jgi:hypothetical protein
MADRNKIPTVVIAVVSDSLATYNSHTTLNGLFMRVGAPGDVPEGNKVDKCRVWLQRINNDPRADGHRLLGELIEEFMEREGSSLYGDAQAAYEKTKEDIRKALAKHGLAYQVGGRIVGGATLPTRTLEALLKERDFSTIDQEFGRALANVEVDPPAAVTSACAILEALCKIYIEDEHLDKPEKQDLRAVWKVVQKRLNLEPSSVESDDLKRILQGLASVADGISAFRTHAGSAHGHGRTGYRPLPRHARLAIHSAHTLVSFSSRLGMRERLSDQRLSAIRNLEEMTPNGLLAQGPEL